MLHCSSEGEMTFEFQTDCDIVSKEEDPPQLLRQKSRLVASLESVILERSCSCPSVANCCNCSGPETQVVNRVVRMMMDNPRSASFTSMSADELAVSSFESGEAVVDNCLQNNSTKTRTIQQVYCWPSVQRCSM